VSCFLLFHVYLQAISKIIYCCFANCVFQKYGVKKIQRQETPLPAVRKAAAAIVLA
jgi:hypothetical protein